MDATVRAPLRAEHRGFELVRGEHQRRHVKIAVKHIAQPGLAADRYPLPDQIGNIAVNGPLRHLELLGQLAGGNRAGRTPHDLDNLKQPVGTTHGGLPADTMLSAGLGDKRKTVTSDT
jgi:hypothetical protein